MTPPVSILRSREEVPPGSTPTPEHLLVARAISAATLAKGCRAGHRIQFRWQSENSLRRADGSFVRTTTVHLIDFGPDNT